MMLQPALSRGSWTLALVAIVVLIGAGAGAADASKKPKGQPKAVLQPTGECRPVAVPA
jgi:hypothetical protein